MGFKSVGMNGQILCIQKITNSYYLGCNEIKNAVQSINDNMVLECMCILLLQTNVLNELNIKNYCVCISASYLDKYINCNEIKQFGFITFLLCIHFATDLEYLTYNCVHYFSNFLHLRIIVTIFIANFYLEICFR